MSKNLRIAVIGAVGSTETTLRTLIEIGRVPLMLLTLPVEMRRRHSDFVELGELAESAGIQVRWVQDVNDLSVLGYLSELSLDLLVVVGWSRICGPELRGMARLGSLGYHPTLLPIMRGRAALAWTILLDARRTGGTLFWLDDGMDTGDIAAQAGFDLSGDENVQQLMDLQMETLATMIPPLFAQLSSGERPARPQKNNDATYTAVRRPADGQIDWNLPADQIERLVRAVTRPYPGAFTAYGNRTLRIWCSRVVHYPNWHAQPGQIFTHDVGGVPVVRCGNRTDLALLEYQVESTEQHEVGYQAAISGQPRLGISR